jgi:hypothetical protein
MPQHGCANTGSREAIFQYTVGAAIITEDENQPYYQERSIVMGNRHTAYSHRRCAESAERVVFPDLAGDGAKSGSPLIQSSRPWRGWIENLGPSARDCPSRGESYCLSVSPPVYNTGIFDRQTISPFSLRSLRLRGEQSIFESAIAGRGL